LTCPSVIPDFFLLCLFSISSKLDQKNMSERFIRLGILIRVCFIDKIRLIMESAKADNEFRCCVKKTFEGEGEGEV
jgi:hypothetical protein